MSSFSSESSNFIPKFRFRFGYSTDIGGGSENQDDFLVWTNRNQQIFFACILDGHGREVGSLAANVAKKVIFDMLTNYEENLISDPKKFIINLFKICHIVIKFEFIRELLVRGYDIMLTKEGYLVKRKNPNSDCKFYDYSINDEVEEDLLVYIDYLVQYKYLKEKINKQLHHNEDINSDQLNLRKNNMENFQNYQGWACVQGGTTLSIITIIDDKLWVANVGDSTGIICTKSKIFGKQYEGIYKTKEVDSSIDIDIVFEKNECTDENSINGLSSIHILTNDHSPENFYEFLRLREFRRSQDDTEQPAIRLIYDTPRIPKLLCPLVYPSSNLPNSVYDFNKKKILKINRCFPSQKGTYYKNTRREWSTLASTPNSAQFTDALAFTRSLGDFHLHTYGVTHLPEINSINLSDIFNRLNYESSSINETNSKSSNIKNEKSIICIVLCSDGVWDNWIFEDVKRFVMDLSCLNALKQADLNKEDNININKNEIISHYEEGAQKITKSLIQRNKIFSKNNFGRNADNATSILVYIEKKNEF